MTDLNTNTTKSARPIAPDDQAQRDAAIDPNHSVLVQAPAGSGKTGVLLLRFLNCLQRVERPEQVVAITFTRKAAGEIRERVSEALNAAEKYRQGQDGEPENDYEQVMLNAASAALARDEAQGWGLLYNPARLRIQTFDSFGISLTRKMPLLSGMASATPTEDSAALYRDAIYALFRHMEAASTPTELKTALGRVLDYASNRVESLVPLLSELLGKRDQWLRAVIGGDFDDMQALLEAEINQQFKAATKTLKANDIQDVFDDLHALSNETEILSWATQLPPANALDVEHLPLLTKVANTLLVKGKPKLSQRLTKTQGIIAKNPNGNRIKAWSKDIFESIENEGVAKALQQLRNLPSPEFSESNRELCADIFLVLRHLLGFLQLGFNESGVVDFNEIGFRATRALAFDSGEGVIGDALFLEDRIEHILVDEMQDTSVNQLDLLGNLCQAWEPNDGRSIFLCGDLLQSIYLFRGAQVSLFQELVKAKEFAQRPLKLLQLSANFRSSPTLVNWVNGVFPTIVEEGINHYTKAQPQLKVEGSVHCHSFLKSEQKDAAKIAQAQRMLEIIKATPEDQNIAVLVRSRKVLNPLISLLKKEKIDFTAQDIDLLVGQVFVQEYLALLRALWHKADRSAWVGLLRASFVGLSWQDILHCCHAVDQQLSENIETHILQGDLTSLSADGKERVERLRLQLQAIYQDPRSADLGWSSKALWHSLGAPLTLDEAQQSDMKRVQGLLAKHCVGGQLQDISAFEDAIAKLYASAKQSRLELMTIHKAKGLEFDVVLLPGLDQKPPNDSSPLFHWRRRGEHMLIAPKPAKAEGKLSEAQELDAENSTKLYQYLASEQGAEGAAEAERLLYVALTRAKRHMHLLGTVDVNKDGEIRATANSLLGRLWPAIGPGFEEPQDCDQSNAVDDLFESIPDDDSSSESYLKVPTRPRINVDAKVSLAPYLRAEQPISTTLRTVATMEQRTVLEDNIEDRAVGLVFHELMSRLGLPEAGSSIPLSEKLAQLEHSITPRLRHHCHPEPSIDSSKARIVDMAQNTLDCEKGQWILHNYETAANEQALRRRVGDIWRRLIIDRLFVDGNCCWIIDYKTARATGNLQSFMAAQNERYAVKMASYREAIAATGQFTEVRAALYFPAHQHLEVIE